MSNNLGRFALFGCVGVGGAAVILYSLSDGEREPRPVTIVADDTSTSATTTAGPAATAPGSEIAVNANEGRTAATGGSDPGPATPATFVPESSSDTDRVLAESLLSRLTEQHSLDEASVELQDLDGATASLLQDLLDSVSIRCEFGPGNGATWQTRNTALYHDAEWQGGPIQYDSIDIPAGTAVMATSFAQRQVQAIATRVGLQFSMFAPNAMWLTTVFAERDASERYPAVLSTQSAYSGRTPDAAQFHGACETVLVSRESLKR